MNIAKRSQQALRAIQASQTGPKKIRSCRRSLRPENFNHQWGRRLFDAGNGTKNALTSLSQSASMEPLQQSCKGRMKSV